MRMIATVKPENTEKCKIVVDFFWRDIYAAPEFDTLAKAIRYAAQVKRHAIKVRTNPNVALYPFPEYIDHDFAVVL